MYEIVFYDDMDGNSPVLNLLADLNEKALANDKSARIQLNQISYSISRLKLDGTRAGEEFTKRIQGDIWELRPGNHRIFFFGWNGNHLVLLHSFIKKSNKTPKREIQQAEREMRDWLDRHQ